MSRIGKLPITVPNGVKAAIVNRDVAIEGPLGKLHFVLGSGVEAKVDGGKILVTSPCRTKQEKADFGTARATINNLVAGVTKGWKRSLELSGVGFTAKLDKDVLVLTVGFSHDVRLNVPKGVKCAINKNTIDLDSADRELLGTFAAKIRKTKPPEPYLGKGIKYSDETIRRKAGKTGKK